MDILNVDALANAIRMAGRQGDMGAGQYAELLLPELLSVLPTRPCTHVGSTVTVQDVAELFAHVELWHECSEIELAHELLPSLERLFRPNRETAMNNSDQQPGLHRKFEVRRVDGGDAPGGKHDGCEYFVLDLTHDPHALPALTTYLTSLRLAGTHPQLANDLDAVVARHLAIALTKIRDESDAQG